MREAQQARLHRLADSINDTARMARTSLSLVLLVALYLGLTLVASTDENLLLNGQVTLPQAGVGISVEESYIFAPPIFFYLHIQLLFLLSVLARKVHTFEAALKEEFPDAFLPRLQNKVEVKRGECWEWLSAFAFVQLFRRTPGMPRVLKVGARTLAWFGIEAVPLALLFVIDISFVRYQSAGITWSHHCIFILDLVSITIFNRLVFRRRDRIWGNASVSVAIPGNAGVPPAFGVGRRPAFLGRIGRLMPYRIWWKHLRGLSAIRSDWWILVRSAKMMPAWLWISVRGTLAVCMVFLLIYAAHPPHFDPRTVENDRRSIWGERDRNFWQAVWDDRDRENPLDAGPCHWWRLGCRHLDVRNKWLLGAQPEDLIGSVSDEITPETVGDIRRFHLGSPDLARRRLRFARFGSVYLQSVDLREAELQGADLRGAQLQGADLEMIQLQGAGLGWAKLQGAHLWGAKLQGAHLRRAELQRADLRGAGLQGANLAGAELQGTDLEEAQLQGANLAWAKLQGARLLGAKLQGTDLEEAQLQGANLKWAKLQGAHLRGAKLKGANLAGAELQGADLTMAQLQGANLTIAQLQGANLKWAKLQGANLAWAKLQGSSGKPDSCGLAWMHNVSFDFSNLSERDQYIKKLLSDETKEIELAWQEGVTLKRHLKKSLSDQEIFGGAKLNDRDWVFCQRKDANWPEASDVHSDAYWDAWAKWASEFACENEYTARSRLQFLSLSRFHDTPLRRSLPDFRRFLRKEGIYDRARNKVRDELSKARRNPECAGLRDLSENEWQAFVDG